MTYRPDIDGLRAVSVLAVLVFHIFPESLPGGFAGVDAFFVISGFLITGLVQRGLNEGTFSFRSFYARRIRRLLPAAQFTIAAVLLYCATVAPLAVQPVAISAVWSALSGANLHFYSLAGYFDTSAITKPLLHMWSLGVEEQFYLFWPFSLWGVSKLSAANRKRNVVGFLLVVGVGSFLWSFSVLSKQPDAAFYLPHFRVWEFALGAFVGFVPEPPRFPAVREILWLVGAALLGSSFFLLQKTEPFPGLNGLAPCLGTVLLLWSHSPKVLRFVLSNPVSVYIGRISYPVYLVHWPLVVLYTDVIFDTPTDTENGALIVASLLLGAGMHHLVEEPFRRQVPWSSRLTFGRPVLANAVFAAALVGGALWLEQLKPQVGDTGAAQNWKALTASSTNLNARISRGICYVDEGQRYLPSRCMRVAKGTANVLIVGDSMAANMYPGFQDYLKGRAHVSLAAAPNCRPLQTPTVTTNACLSRNQVLFSTGNISQFDLILLIGAFNGPERIARLGETISALEKRGAKKVAVIGAPVRYRLPVDQIIWHFKDSTSDALERAMTRYLLEARLPAEYQLHQLAHEQGWDFYSTVNLSCEDPRELSTCRHWVGESDVPIVRDGGHPTPHGAAWFAEKFDEQGLFAGF